jgi:hypothetical protein
VDLDLEFPFNGEIGTVHVECVPNDDPESLGTANPVPGFPVCTATVRYPRRGYRSLFGWVQLVKFTDNASGSGEFEMDPFVLFGDAPSPYCWYGTEPTLFDAPSRSTLARMHWHAHSFLATTRLDEILREEARFVEPIIGFSWGFDIHDETIELQPLARLTTDDWNGHLAVLAQSYPFWRFREGKLS